MAVVGDRRSGAASSGERGEVAWLAAQIRPFTLDYAIALGCGVAGGALALVDPLLLRFLLDHALPTKNLRQLTAAVAALAGAGFLRLLLSWGGTLAGSRAVQKTSWRLRTMLVRHLSNLPFEFHRRASAGDAFFRLERDVDQIAETGGGLFLQAITFSVSTAAVLIGLMYMNPLLTLSVLPLNLLFFCLRKNLRRRLDVLSVRAQSESSAGGGLLQEYLSAIPQFQLLGCERREARRVIASYSRRLRAELDRRRFELSTASISSGAVVLGTCLVLAIGGYQVVRGIITAGTLVACYAWMSRLFDPFSVMLNMYSRFARVGVSIRRIREPLKHQSAIPDGFYVPQTPRVRGFIDIQDVSFRYEDGPTVLRGLNLQISAGERLALVGPSGVGKTTIGRLLARMETAQAGAVLLDCIDVREYKQSSLRSQVCYLPQEPLVLDRSIRENLMLGNPRSNDEELWHSLRAVELESFIRSLPAGLDTRAGPQGTCLSGGERQRLVLARCLLRQPAILVLDEPTSSLDEPTESAIIRHLLAAFPTQTILYITHRASSLRWVDRIAVIENGVIAEEGAASEVLRGWELMRRHGERVAAP